MEINRRRFFVGAGLVGTLALHPALLRAAQGADKAPALPPNALFDRDAERYWAEMRRQFLIPDDEVYLNNGTVGSSPWPVLRAVFDGYLKVEQMADDDPENYPIWGYGPWNEFRDVAAEFVGARRDEIALTRNCTEGNSYIANGLEMKAGDEVLMSDQEHPGGEQPWQLRAKRYGIVVRKFEIPKPPKSAAEILNRINDALTPRTRIVFVSHISTTTGVVLPAKEIAALARSKGVLSAFDGAHVIGMMPLNIPALGCDFYTTSPHKWLMAPKGTGLLYVREEVQGQVWNTIVTEGWNNPNLKAQRFQQIGSSNVPALWGLRVGIQLARQIGLERIEARHRQMADHIHGEMMKRGAESWTSPDPALRCAIATVNVPPIVRMELERWMWKTHKIRIRGGEPSKLRLSTPYYLLRKDVDRFLAAFDEYRSSVRRG